MSDERLTRDHVVWAYRLLLDREVESDEAIQVKLAAWTTPRELRVDMMASEEFGLKNPEHAALRERAIVITELAGGRRLFVDLADQVIGWPIVRGVYEPGVLQFMTSVLRPGDVSVDVGAHIGFSAIQMAQAVGDGGHVYAFEPMAGNADLLRLSIAENGFGALVSIEEAAVSDAIGVSTLWFSPDRFNTGGAFLGLPAEQDRGTLMSVAVPTTRLDDCSLRRPVRLIKVDVEGAEPAVYRGAAALIARDGPVIVSEVHPAQLARVSRCTPADLFEQLRALGLRGHWIHDGRLGPLVRTEEITGVSTVAFVPRE
jgi:FkbM family methyltransferase